MYIERHKLSGLKSMKKTHETDNYASLKKNIYEEHLIKCEIEYMTIDVIKYRVTINGQADKDWLPRDRTGITLWRQ